MIVYDVMIYKCNLRTGFAMLIERNRQNMINREVEIGKLCHKRSIKIEVMVVKVSKCSKRFKIVACKCVFFFLFLTCSICSLFLVQHISFCFRFFIFSSKICELVLSAGFFLQPLFDRERNQNFGKTETFFVHLKTCFYTINLNRVCHVHN